MEKKIVILGAGFAGLKLASKLNNNQNFSVTLIDRYNFHQFQPLFYQVATGKIDPSNISFPLRNVFRKSKNVHIRLAEVNKLDRENNKVETSIGDFSYDYLVIATGCKTNYFGNKQIEELSYPMKSTHESIALLNRLLTNFESSYFASPEEKEEIQNIVIVGGGPTGVEIAGSIAEMKSKVLAKDYPDMDFSQLNIYLLEGSPNLLGPMSDISRKKSRQYLENMGIKVWTDSLVTNYDGKTVTLKDGREIKSLNLIWTAGISGNLLEGIDSSLLQRGNRIKVDRFNRVEGASNIFAIGDVSYMETPIYPNSHPQLASVAISQALNLSQNLKKYGQEKEINIDKFTPYEYKNPGSMAVVAKNKAVVDLSKFSFQGFFAWITWMGVHLTLVEGAKNKLFIFLSWFQTYFTNNTSLRLIMRSTRKDFESNVDDYAKFPTEK